MTTDVAYIRVYQDAEGEFRWSAIARNGEIVAQGESHTRKGDAARAARDVLGWDIPVEDDTGQTD